MRAPTAMRRPISRVRSVTETSMMFMIPMPPTSRLTEATLMSSMVMVSAISTRVAAISSTVRTVKSSSSGSGDAVALAQQPGDLHRRRLHRRRCEAAETRIWLM